MMYRMLNVAFLVYLLHLVAGEPKVYLKEEFSSETYVDKWIESVHKGKEQGKFVWSAGKFYSDDFKDKGIQTSQDAKFYGISRKLEESFSNEAKTLVIQFQVKHEQMIDCGGGYIKVLGSDLKQKEFNSEMPYKIMFGPDICGAGTKKVHVIFNFNGKNLLTKKEIECIQDHFTHLYTLVLNPNNTYKVLIDNNKVESGNLEDDWDFLEAKKIKDPNVQKPVDWEDNAEIDDLSDVKPDDWDVARTIPDPNATKPADWDDEMDGEWEPSSIDNPDFKGEWNPKKMSNPKYQGAWIHPEVDNPAYTEDKHLYRHTDIGTVGFDLWQVKSGTIFDNILLTDDEEYASRYAEETWRVTAVGEKKMKDWLDEQASNAEKERRKKVKAEHDEKKKAEQDEKKKAEQESGESKEPEETVAETGSEAEKHEEL